MNKGFTLVELAVVLVIIGLIMGMGIKGIQLKKHAEFMADMRQLNKLEVAWNTYYAKHMKYPPIESSGTFAGHILPENFKDVALLAEKDFWINKKTHRIAFVNMQVNPDGSTETTTINYQVMNFFTLSTTDRYDSIRLPFSYMCKMEVLLDDKNSTTGAMRVQRYTMAVNSGADYDDCDILPSNNLSAGYKFSMLML